MYKIMRQTGLYIPKTIRIANNNNLYKIGDRDIVGYGRNGTPCYSDNIVYPMPAIRWKENTPDVMRLRKLELGDWNKISLQDKKSLYRASFRQTYEEFEAGDGHWKNCISDTFISVDLAFLYYIWLYKTGSMLIYPIIIYYKHDTLLVYQIPDTFTPEKEKAQIIRMLMIMVNPVTGIFSKFDYENWKWKSDT